MKNKNHWKTATIIFAVIFIVLLIYVMGSNPKDKNYNDIKTITGIKNSSTINSIVSAIDKSPTHSVNLCNDLSNLKSCITIGRLD